MMITLSKSIINLYGIENDNNTFSILNTCACFIENDISIWGKINVETILITYLICNSGIMIQNFTLLALNMINGDFIQGHTSVVSFYTVNYGLIFLLVAIHIIIVA